MGLHAGSFGNPVTIIVSKARNGHRFTLWIRSQANVSSFRLTLRDLPPQETYITPLSPISPFVKLNTDEISLGNLGPLGFGGIVQDSRGLCLFRFYGHCDHTMNMHVELLTILCRSIIHTFQKVNACVDILTKKVASTSVPLVMLELCPDDVFRCVTDALHTNFVRL